MPNAANRMAQLLTQQVYLLRREGMNQAAAQLAEEVRQLHLLAALPEE